MLHSIPPRACATALGWYVCILGAARTPPQEGVATAPASALVRFEKLSKLPITSFSPGDRAELKGYLKQIVQNDFLPPEPERMRWVHVACLALFEHVPGSLKTLELDLSTDELYQAVIDRGLAWGARADAAWAALDLGRIQAKDNRGIQALETFRRGLDARDEKLTPWLYFEIAQHLRAEGRWKEAAAAVQDGLASLQPIEKVKDHGRARAYLLGERGRQALDLGLTDLAWSEFRAEELQLEELAQKQFFREGVEGLGLNRVASWLHAVDFDLAMGEMPEARHTIATALADSRLSEVWPSLPEIRKRLEALDAIAETNEAIGFPDRLKAVIPRLKGKLEAVAAAGDPALHGEVLLVRAHVEVGDSENASKAAGALRPLLAGAGEVFLRLELCELESRIARLKRTEGVELERVAKELESAFTETLELWDRAERRAGGLGFLQLASRRSVLCELIQLSVQRFGSARGAEAGLQAVLEAQARGSLARALNAPVGSLSAIREKLIPDGGGLLLYLHGPSETCIFAIDRSEVTLSIVPLLKPTRQLAMEARELLERRPAVDAVQRRAEVTRWQKLALELREAVIPKRVLDRVAGWKTLTVVGADFLGGLPFDALPGWRGTPLGCELPMVVLPSVPVALAVAARPTEPRAHGWVELRAPKIAPELASRFPGLAPLSVRDRDVRSWRGSWSAGPEFSDANATESALRGALEKSSPLLLQILAHGIEDANRERPSGIALAGADGDLWCDDVEAMKAPPLVVLATCGAARGKLRRGEDSVQHLGGAFLRAGARAVLLSQGDLELDSTSALLAAFHAALRPGRSPAQALLEARQQMASRSGDDPRSWALLRWLGLGHEPVAEK